MLKADLHVHTLCSRDSANQPEAIVARAQERGISCLAITDHNTMRGLERVRAIAPFPIIPGEEIRTTAGEIIGLFITEEIPKGLPPLEVVKRIKDQGGLVYVPHPFDRLRRSVLKTEVLEEIRPFVDAIEVFNSRTTLIRDSEKARLFALRHQLPMGGGSDAHSIGEIGQTYVELPEFEGAQGFLAALAQATIHCRRSNPLVHVASTWAKTHKRVVKRLGRGTG